MAPPVSGDAGEIGELRPGAVADIAVWPLTGPAFAGAVADPVEAWLRCGPVTARHTVVAGRAVVADGHLVHPAVDERLTAHRHIAAAMQRLDLITVSLATGNCRRPDRSGWGQT